MVKIRNSSIGYKKYKKGWIRLVEVFISIILLGGVLLIVTTRNSAYSTEVQDEISEREVAILRDIELNNTLRTEILSIPQQSLPLEWGSFVSQLEEVADRIGVLTPANLECRAKMCLVLDNCIMDWSPDGDVYAKSVIISADLDTYSPRQLKLFCTKKA